MNCKWCGDPLEGKRAHAEYCDSSCRAAAWEERQEKGEKALVSVASAAQVHAAASADEAKTYWQKRVRYAILTAANQHPTGEVHADDIRELRVPEELRRSIVGAEFKKLARERLLFSTGETRRSRVRSRHGNPSLVYRLRPAGAVAWAEMPEPEEITAALRLVPDSVGAEAPKSPVRHPEAA